MATLTVQDVTETGITPTYASASAGGDRVANGGEDVLLHFKNSGGSPITVTVASNDTTRDATGLGPVTKADASVAVPATTGDKMIGPFPRLAFNGSDGKISITYSATPTGVTVAAIRVPRIR